jgi:hypothetical protein
VFTPDVMSILMPGTSLIVGTVGSDGEPRATRAFALTVVDPGVPVVRVLMSAEDGVAVSDLDNGVIAVTAADVRTLRSVQLKGRVTLVEQLSDADRAVYRASTDAFIAAIVATDRHPPAMVRRILPASCIALELAVEELYDQTPGPQAGRAVVMPS